MKRFTVLAMSVAVLALITGAHTPPQSRGILREAPVMLPVLGGHVAETGYIPPEMDLSHLDGSSAPTAMARQALPSSWDWRTDGGGAVTPVKNQASCGSCYTFAAIADAESYALMDESIIYDFSENNAKECNWREVNNVAGWGSCDGGNYWMLTTLFSTKGLVLEADDPYVASDVACNGCVPYQKTLLDWRIISGHIAPTADVLRQYVHDYGPIATSMYVDDTQGFDGTYTGTCTLSYPSRGSSNHAVVIVGWSDALPPVCGSATGDPASGWIVRNSWGSGWGDGGYFYMVYNAGDLGRNSSFGHTWQEYNAGDHVMYYDDDGWTTTWAMGDDKKDWGLVAYTPPADTVATAIEFWTADAPTTVDIYLYDDFDNTTLSTLLAEELDLTYPEAGYHSVSLDPPVPLTAGNEIYATVFFSNTTYTFTVPADSNGPHETQRTWISDDATSWYDLGANQSDDVAIRIRTSHPNGGAYALQGDQCGYDATTCPLYDDGTHGDAFAGDHIHSRDHTVDTPLAAHDAYVFYRLDGDKTLPSTGSLEFGAIGSCPLYLLAQGNPYGIAVTDCDAYAHVTCDAGGSSFGPVSLIGNEDFAAPAETYIEEGTTLDLRVEIYAAGLTDGGTATEGEAISVSLETRQWDAAAQGWGTWAPYAPTFSFETDDGDNWQYLLEDVSLPVGIHELRSTYTDWAGNTGTTGANTRTVFVSDAVTTPHAIDADGDLAEWRANERHDGLDGAQSYVTWDDRFIYAGWTGGSGNDRCIAGFDLNLGTVDQVATYAGAVFPATGQPDYVLDYDKQLIGTARFLQRNGTGWTDIGAADIQTGQDGSGTTCEARIPRTAFGGSLGPEDDLGLVMFQSNAAGDAIWAAFPAAGNSSGSRPPLDAQFHWPTTGPGTAPNAPDEGGRSEYAGTTVSGDAAGTYILGDTGATIAFPSAGDAPDTACTIGARVYEGHPHAHDPDAVRRYTTLEGAACAGFSGDLTLTYADGELNGNEETALDLYRWTGAAWQLYTVAGGDRDAAANQLTVRNISEFSDWITADGIPTVVALVDFRAAHQGTAVELTWETGFGVAALLWATTCIVRGRRRPSRRSLTRR
jgi:C1A family cysteine protease